MSKTCPFCGFENEGCICTFSDNAVSKSALSDRVINRFVYHYCAQFQKYSGGATHYIDGIALLDERITCMDGYRKVKPLIEPKYHGELCIMSLSFIGMEQGL